jgi:PIN domain nuclease of toxin-antitoxin system
MTASHALRVAALPLHHRDPFDRMLIAQAQVESMILVSADSKFNQYEVSLLWAGN